MEGRALSKDVPDNAPIYSSQLSCIFSLASEEVVILLMYVFTAITDEEVFVIRDLILSAVSEIVIPEDKLSANKFWVVCASKSASAMNCSVVKLES